jgi:hypothetical protein
MRKVKTVKRLMFFQLHNFCFCTVNYKKKTYKVPNSSRSVTEGFTEKETDGYRR